MTGRARSTFFPGPWPSVPKEAVPFLDARWLDDIEQGRVHAVIAWGARWADEERSAVFPHPIAAEPGWHWLVERSASGALMLVMEEGGEDD